MKKILLIIIIICFNYLYGQAPDIELYEFLYGDYCYNQFTPHYLTDLDNGYCINFAKIYGIGSNLNIQFYEAENCVSNLSNPEIYGQTTTLLETTLTYFDYQRLPECEFTVSRATSGGGTNCFPVRYSSDPVLFEVLNAKVCFGFVVPGGKFENIGNNVTRHRIYNQNTTVGNMYLSCVYINVSSNFYHYEHDLVTHSYREQKWNAGLDDYVINTTSPPIYTFSLQKVLKHEIGHIFGLGHLLTANGNTMSPFVENQPQADTWGYNDHVFWGKLYPSGSAENFDQENIEKPITFMTVYPNPVKEKINIVINNKLDKMYKISIYNVKGQKINDIVNNSEHISLDLKNNNNISSGIYFIKLYENNKTISTKKIAIIK